MTKTIGVLGLGSIGLRHATNLINLGHHVVGYDPDPLRRAAFGGELVAHEAHLATEVDAVVIASPTPQHASHIVLCSAVPCFVEKPIGGENGAPTNISSVLMVGYNLRFHSCVKQAKKWLDDGLIGEPLWANLVVAQYNNKPAYLRDGVILNWSHEIDLALYLLGPAKVVASSTGMSSGHDDICDILLVHEDKCRSSVHLDYVTKPEIRQTIIVGTDAAISFDLVHRRAFMRSSDGKVLDSFEGRDTWNDNYIEEMLAFLDRIDGKETIGATAKDGLAVLDICLQVRRAAGLDS